VQLATRHSGVTGRQGTVRALPRRLAWLPLSAVDR